MAYRNRNASRLVVMPGLRDKREAVVRFEALSRLDAHELYHEIMRDLPKGYRIEEEHILGQRDREGRSQGQKCDVTIIFRHIDTVNTKALDLEQWGHLLEELLT